MSSIATWLRRDPQRRGHRHRRAALIVTALLGATALVAQPTSNATLTAAATPALRINEVLAAPGEGSSDQIELYNASGADVDISSWTLLDSTATTPFTFRANTRVPAGGYLVVYAGGTPTGSEHRTTFSLDSEGDEIRLRDTAGQLVDSIKFGFQVPNFTISRTGAAANTWALTTPTLGQANAAPVALGSPTELRVNEWASRINFRLDHDMIELFNTATAPVALGGMHLTDDPARPDKEHLQFAPLSFIGPRGSGTEFLALYQGDFFFGLSADGDRIALLGENLQAADDVTFASQTAETSSGRVPDGGVTRRDFTIPTPGLPNETAFPADYDVLLRNLRVTEVMYQPSAPSNAGDYEYVELQNIGSAALRLDGVRFTNGISYTFPSGTSLPAGAYIVVARNRNAFLQRYPAAAGALAPGSYTGDLDNTGETIALTLPARWDVHVLSFRYEVDWFPATKGGGHSLVIANAAGTAPVDWREASSWRASAALNGSPGAAESGGPSATASRIINLSILTGIESAGDNFTMGYVVGGSGTSGAKPLVIRAAGPSLGALGVGGTLADPKFELFAGTTKTRENDNWGGSAQLTAAMAAVGAFPYASANSLDAAIAVDVTTRDNSVKVSASGSGTGLVIAEVYDATPESSVTATTPRLINVSVLKEFGAGFTAGFVIRGSAPKTVLIRAVGPGLANVGVPSSFVVSDPQVTLFRGNTQLRTNNDWAASAAATFAQVGAFALPAGSKDAALVETLPPGDYTVQVSGVGGVTGLGLVEVYEVP